MAKKVSTVQRVLNDAYKDRARRKKALMETGISYGEACRQIDCPNMTKEEYAAFFDKYTEAYTKQFGIGLKS